jgi:hypothetical protein
VALRRLSDVSASPTPDDAEAMLAVSTSLVRPRVAPEASFEFYPTGHERPFSVLYPARTPEEFMGKMDLATRDERPIFPVIGPARTRRAWLAASSDPRHVLETLAHTGTAQAAQAIPGTVVALTVSDIVPAVVARSLVLLYACLGQAAGRYCSDAALFRQPHHVRRALPNALIAASSASPGGSYLTRAVLLLRAEAGERGADAARR